MQRIFTIVIAFFLLAATPAVADAVSDASPLEGNWTHNSYDGVFTQLEIEADGKFVFRELHSQDLRRSYMCGFLTDNGDRLSLAIGQHKERSRGGDISQAVGKSQGEFTVLARSENRLVISVDSRTVVLHRG